MHAEDELSEINSEASLAVISLIATRAAISRTQHPPEGN